MMEASALPLWLAVLIGLLAVAGSGLTLIGSIGLLRFESFFRRIHAPTLGTTLGGGAILIASMLLFSTIESRLALGEVLIAVFLIVTTPVSFIALAMAARERGRREREGDDEHD
jgi:multicomponent K+:H+ antiporter subunit G